MADKKLAKAVLKRLKQVGEKKRPMFDKAAVEAMQLADKFETVKADEYVLPLDAMAGFRIPLKA
jgi:hypothetical protein